MRLDSPDVGGEVDPAPTEPPAGPRHLGDRSRVAIALLLAVMVTALASLWADLGELGVLDRVLDGERVSLKEITDVENRVGITATAYVIASVLSAITFLLWYGRAYGNVIAMGLRRPRWGRRWAIAYWFVPILNWFRPKQVMNDIWRGSDPAAPLAAPPHEWARRPVSPLLHWWWAAWVVSVFVANYATRITFSTGLDPSVAELHDEAVAYIAADIVDVVAAILAIAVVRSLTARHERRRSLFEAGEPAAPPAVPAPASAEASAGG